MTYLNKIKIFVLVFMFILFTSSINAQWNIPADAKNKKPPIDPTHTLVKTGKDLYKSNCASCHGTPGQGNNIAAIGATDLGTADYQHSHSSGQTFFQVEQGNGGMPSFREKFSSDEKWCLIFYIKSFDKDFEISGEELKEQKADLRLSLVEKIRTVKAYATTKDKSGKEIPLEGAEVQFFIKRMFGNMQIGELVPTDNKGMASIKIPENIPGDEEGKLNLLVKFKDTDTYGKVIKSKTIKWGSKLKIVNITDKREMWGSLHRVPLWVLFSYFGMTIGVWLVIGYVVFQIIRLKKL